MTRDHRNSWVRLQIGSKNMTLKSRLGQLHWRSHPCLLLIKKRLLAQPNLAEVSGNCATKTLQLQREKKIEPFRACHSKFLTLSSWVSFHTSSSPLSFTATSFSLASTPGSMLTVWVFFRLARFFEWVKILRNISSVKWNGVLCIVGQL